MEFVCRQEEVLWFLKALRHRQSGLSSELVGKKGFEKVMPNLINAAKELEKAEKNLALAIEKI